MGSWRQQQSLRQFREEIAREESERTEREMRPVREAAARLNQTARELWNAEREMVETGKDTGFELPASMVGITMPLGKAKEFNASESARFVEMTPSYYRCKENFETITSYLYRNGVMLADAETWRRAYVRLQEFGLLRERPAPEPTPEPIVETQEIDPEQQRWQRLETYYHAPVFRHPDGRVFTEAQVDAMTADEFRKLVPLALPVGKFLKPNGLFD